MSPRISTASMSSTAAATAAATATKTTELQGGAEYTSFVMMLIFAGILVVICIIIYIIYLLRTSNYRATDIIKLTTRTNMTSNNDFLNGTASLASPYSQSFSFSFWLYINEFRPAATSGKHLIWAAKDGTGGPSSMVVFMDGGTNTMYVSVASNKVLTTDNIVSSLNDLVPTPENPRGAVLDDKYLTFTIDYVPIQRWVQFTIVMMDASNVSVYQDNALRAVRTPAYFASETRPMFNVPETMYLSNQCNKVAGSDCDMSLDAYLSTFTYYNYAISFREVERKYSKGPDAIEGWWSWLGFGRYRLQWPVVSVDENGEDNISTIG